MLFVLAISFVSALLSTSCNKEKELGIPSKEEIKNVQKASTFNQNYTSFANQIGLNKLLLSEPTPSWQKLDNFYRNFIANEEFKKSPYFERAKQTCHFYIIEELGLYKDKSELAELTKKYYLEELKKTDFISPIVVNRLLENTSNLNINYKKEYCQYALTKYGKVYEEDLIGFQTKLSEKDQKFLTNYKNSLKKLKSTL